MSQPVCELCGSSDFLKDEGMFVCQGCGTKYTLEEARKLMGGQLSSEPAQQAQQPQVEPPSSPGAFDPQGMNVPAFGAREVNNYICQGFQMLLDEYEQLEHPSKAQQEQLVARAKECLVILDNAALLDPSDCVQNALIYTNCVAIVDAVEDTHYYEKGEDGEWESERLPFGTKLTIPGQKDSWDEKLAAQRAIITDAYVRAHPDDQKLREQLQYQIGDLEAQLAELKDEKRSKGFFNFSEKREVKDRMKPLKDERKRLEAQVREIDRAAERHADAQIEALASSFVLLDF